MTLNIAVLGPGRIAENSLVPAIKKAAGIALWSVLSRDLARARDFATRHQAHAPTSAYNDLGALLADPELDAVLIASPDRLHAPQAIAAARAGKHVLCEKPMAAEVSEADAMIAECKSAGVRLGVAYHMRWHRGHRLLAGSVHGGEFGDIRHMRVMWARKQADASNWRASPEVGRWWSLAGVGTHCLDQVRWLMMPSCGEIVSLRSVINNRIWNSPHDETAVLALQFENGATAEICTSVVFDAPQLMEVYASDGYAVCENTLGPHGSGRIKTHKGELDYQVEDPYIGEIEDFVAAIRDAREPEVGGEEARRNVELLVQAMATT